MLRYYKNLSFALFDVFLKLAYAFINPYRISKKFLQKNDHPQIHMYGETPIALFDILLKKCKLDANDTFLELGCGRGRLCAFTRFFYKCKVVGVEQIPIFVKILNFLLKLFRLKNIFIFKKNMLDMNYSNASFIFLYGTCLENNELEKIIQNLLSTKEDTKILTISVALCDYNENFKTIDEFSIKLPWGNTNAYLQIKTKKDK